MKTSSMLLSASLLLLIFSCKDQAKTTEVSNEVTKVQEGLVPASWVAKRVQKTKSKLEQTDAGKVVWNAMEAHGGLENWYNNGALSFRFNYFTRICLL